MPNRTGQSSRAAAVLEFSAAVIDARRPMPVAAALGRLLRDIGARYYVIEESGPAARPRRLVPRRCSALASAALARWRDLEAGRSGVWQPTRETLVVRALDPGGAPGTLTAAIGLARPLQDDGRLMTQLGRVVKAALARVLALEAEQRRQWLVDALCDASGDRLVLYSASGARIAWLPDADAESSGRAEDWLRRAATDARGRATFDRVVSVGAAEYALRHRWLDSPVRGDGRVQLVEARRRSRVPQVFQDRIAQSGLTRREVEVAMLMLNGHTNRAIADSLCVSQNTIKTHCRHIFEKLGISRRIEFLQVFRQAEPPSAGEERDSRRAATPAL